MRYFASFWMERYNICMSVCVLVYEHLIISNASTWEIHLLSWISQVVFYSRSVMFSFFGEFTCSRCFLPMFISLGCDAKFSVFLHILLLPLLIIIVIVFVVGVSAAAAVAAVVVVIIWKLVNFSAYYTIQPSLIDMLMVEITSVHYKIERRTNNNAAAHIFFNTCKVKIGKGKNERWRRTRKRHEVKREKPKKKYEGNRRLWKYEEIYVRLSMKSKARQVRERERERQCGECMCKEREWEGKEPNDRRCMVNGVAKTSTYKTLATFSFVYKTEAKKENMCTHTLNCREKT